MKRRCDFCGKPAAAAIEEKAIACAECVAVRFGDDERQESGTIRWLDQEPERDGSIWLPESVVAEMLAEKASALEKVLPDYGLVGGKDGPFLKLRRKGELRDGEAESIMLSETPLGFGGASEHVTRALYEWLEKEKT